MSNGLELNDRIRFENSVKSLSADDRIIRVAMMLYDHCQDQSGLAEQVRANTVFRRIGTWAGTIITAAVITTLIITILGGM